MPGPLRVRGSVMIPQAELRWRFSRSPGPGGQSVNTTDSRIELSYDLAASAALGPTLKTRARCSACPAVSPTECSPSAPPSTAPSCATERQPRCASPRCWIRPSRPRRGCADQPSLAAPPSSDAWRSSAGAVKPNACAGRPRTSSVDGRLVPLMRNVRTVRVGHHRRRPRTPRPDRPRSISSQDLYIGTPTTGIRRRHRRWTNAAQPAGRHARATLQAGTNHRHRLGAGTTARTLSGRCQP